MTQTIDIDPIPSDQLHSILERTFALAQEWGMVSATEQEWRYQDHEHLLIYNPATEGLQFINTQTNETLSWQNGELIGNIQLTTDQWAEFQELSEWLDSQEVPQSVEIGTVRSPSSEEIIALESTAAQLFEYYASQEISAYKLSEDSTIHYYSVEVDGITYLLSRDDATGEYNLQREESDLDLRSHQGITPRDIQTWLEIEKWLSAQIKLDSYSEDFGWDTDSKGFFDVTKSTKSSSTLQIVDFDL
ncbi:hypothetical protein [Leptodesmis sichuanensis]|uniref:hypothetical protein n=1 Tax=Leptodesmis sichuanensis TaxID=2906798 RepID=UPI001F24C5FC|nr:hypothetical protein [Leptodesmis sichuanensis]UIE38873.1 hypothetical protein KIK02_04475 [Leptodesmis sichuanensis A121]